MSDLQWQASDSKDLIRRDRKTAILQGAPLLAGSALFSVWLSTSDDPVLATIFVGMFVAWLLSVLIAIAGAPRRWRVLEIAPAQLVFDDLGVTWLAPYGSRLLRWDALSISRLGNTWILSVGGFEAGFIPARCLDATESSQLERRVGPAGQVRIGP